MRTIIFKLPLATCLICVSLIPKALGAPTISFPINSQVPPVAHPSEPFEFVFSDSTFSSNTPPIQYTLSKAPQWLKIDGGLRKLYGKPSDEDIGPFTATITALDGSGSIDLEATFMVAANSGITLSNAPNFLLQGLGPTNGKGGLVYPPSSGFEFSFPVDTFSPAGIAQRYEAVSADNTPLPSWIRFDNSKLTFSGTTPAATSLVAPPQTFGLRLIASDIPGFEAASLPFQLIIGSHQLFFDVSYVQANATTEMPFSYSIIREGIILDGQPIASENLSSITANASSWLSFDEQSLTLSGTPPKNGDGMQVNIIALDVFGGEAVEVVDLRVRSGLFTLELPDFDIYRGQSFEYEINRTTLSGSDSDVKLSAEIQPETEWVSFSPDDFVFKGQVPKDAPDHISVELTASTASGDRSESQSFNFNVMDKTAAKPSSSKTTSTSTSTSTNNAAKSTQTGAETTKENSKPAPKRTLTIVLATILPISIVATLVLLFVCVKRCPRKGPRSRSVTPTGDDISRPLPPMQEAWPVATKQQLPPILERPRRFSGFTFFKSHNSPAGGLSSPASSFIRPSGTQQTIIVEDSSGSEYSTPSPSHIHRPIPPHLSPRPPQRPIQRPPQHPSQLAASQNNIVRNFSRISRSPVGRTRLARGPSQRSVSDCRVSRASRYKDGNARRTTSLTAKEEMERRRSSGLYPGKSVAGGPPGFGTPKRSWRRTMSSHARGRDSDGSYETISTEELLGDPSVRLVTASDNDLSAAVEPEETKAYVPQRRPSPFFAGKTPKRRSKTPALSVTPADGEYQEGLMDDVMQSLSRAGSTFTTPNISAHASPSFQHPPSPSFQQHLSPALRQQSPTLPQSLSPSSAHRKTLRQRYINDQERHFQTTSNSNSSPTCTSHAGSPRNPTGTDDSLYQVEDENGNKTWFHRHRYQSQLPRASTATSAFSRGTSYYHDEPFEYGNGIALTSSWVEGPGAGGAYDERSLVDLEMQRQEEGRQRQRAKLVNFTPKRPVSMDDGLKKNMESSCSGDMAFL